MKKLFSALVVLGITLSAVPTLAADKIKVVASFSILGNMVKQVTGDLADVTTIVGPDADAHVYTPNTADAKAVADANVIFVNGLGFETWSQTLIENSGAKAEVFVATEGVTPVKVDGETDPHAWNNLTNGVIYVKNIAKHMVETDPANATTYEKNAKAYSTKLIALHQRALDAFSTLSDGQKTVVTAHDAFGYLAEGYGLTFLAPVGIDTEAEPSAKEIAKLIAHLKQVGAGALFVENIASPTLIEQISRETGIKIGGQLYSDALSKRGGPATSYEKMFEHNLNTLIQTLGKSS